MYVSLMMVFLLHGFTCQAEIVEPQCLSSYDFLHKLMYQVIKVEEDVKNFKAFVDQLKQDRQVEGTEQRNKLSAAIEAFTNKSQDQLKNLDETSQALLAKIEDSADALETKVTGLTKLPAVGFSVKDPKESGTSGQLTFGAVITNQGQGFDTASGVFTCQVPGLYYFSASLLKAYSHRGNVYCTLTTSTGNVRALLNSGQTASSHFALVNSIYVHLKAGETAKLTGCTAFSSFNGLSSFTGFLVSPDNV